MKKSQVNILMIHFKAQQKQEQAKRLSVDGKKLLRAEINLKTKQTKKDLAL